MAPSERSEASPTQEYRYRYLAIQEGDRILVCIVFNVSLGAEVVFQDE